MSDPTAAEIRERHERSREQDFQLLPKDTDEWVFELIAAFNYCRIDRGILLNRLEAAENDIQDYIKEIDILDAEIKRQQEALDAIQEMHDNDDFGRYNTRMVGKALAKAEDLLDG